jgi:hypothetical protein
VETYLEVGPELPVEGESLMEFQLLFMGEIGSDSRAPIKHKIRSSLHPQLRRLWHVNRKLRGYAAHHGQIFHARKQSQTKEIQTHLSESDAIEVAIENWGNNWNLGPFRFVPLVTKERALVCSLEILLLRPDDDTHVTEHGDLDGHVKTLFDGLRMPTSQDQTGNSSPAPDESPFFCLLEDDRLVSELRVKADKLLMLPDKSSVSKHDAFALVKVTINHKYPGTFDQWFA